MNVLPKQLEAYLTFILTYRRFLNCKLQQLLEEFQFFLGRYTIFPPLCIIYTLLLFLRNHRHENQSFIKVATYFNLMNALPKQVKLIEILFSQNVDFLFVNYSKLSLESEETVTLVKDLMLL